MGGGRGTHQEELSFLGRCSLQQWQHQQQHRHRLPQLADPWKPWGLVASGCSCCGACCHLEGLDQVTARLPKKEGKTRLCLAASIQWGPSVLTGLPRCKTATLRHEATGDKYWGHDLSLIRGPKQIVLQISTWQMPTYFSAA